MAGRHKTYKVELDETERRALERVVSAHRSGQAEVQRARVVLTCAEHTEWSDEQVADVVGCSEALVRKWRKRWHETKSVKDAVRPGRPRVFSP